MAIKNDELARTSGGHLPAHRILRVILAASKQGGDMGELYSAFGTQRHVLGEAYGDNVIKQVLKEQNLDQALLKYADETSLDSELEASINSALEVVGNDVGVPIIIFNKDGKRSGYFGPVLLKLPSVSHSLDLWDGLVTLATSEEFYELKRSRDGVGPDTASTAICIP